MLHYDSQATLFDEAINCSRIPSESTAVLRMQAMQQTTARELFRDRVLLDKLCNNPQDFLLDIRQVAALWTALCGTFTPERVVYVSQCMAAWNPERLSAVFMAIAV